VAKPILFARRFRKTWDRLTETQRERVMEIVGALPELMQHPHRHSGYGFRQLRGSPFHEARVDLRWRLVIQIEADQIVLFDVLNHDQVKRLK